MQFVIDIRSWSCHKPEGMSSNVYLMAKLKNLKMFNAIFAIFHGFFGTEIPLTEKDH